MYIFILTVLVVSFIALCFYKRDFWENRYFILFLCVITAFVINLTTNFIVRSKLPTKVVYKNKSPLTILHVPDSALVDGTMFAKNQKYKYDDIDIKYFTKKDSTRRDMFVIFFGGNKVGFIREEDNDRSKIYYGSCDDYYFESSGSDSIAYYCWKVKKYDVKSNWLNSISFPNIKKIVCIGLPPKVLASIDSTKIQKAKF